MKKIISIIIAFLIIILGVIIFFINNQEKNNLTKITVAEVTHSAFYAPWYVAI